MAITNADGIVTPDSENTADPSVYLAAMADSISEGIGGRLAKQEQTAGIKASLPTTWAFDGNSNTVPLTIGSGTNFVNDVLFAGGMATIVVPGLYSVNASVTAGFLDAVPVDMVLMVNFTQEEYNGFATSLTSFVTSPIGTALHLAAGDTVYIQVGVGNSRADTVYLEAAKLSLVLQYAT